MGQDAFSKFHPAVNFLFFMGALGFGMVFQHPAYLAASLIGGICYTVVLKGLNGIKNLAMLLPVLLFVAGINPLFNHRGETILFFILGNPYTLEALAHGAVLAGILLTMMIWFGCYSTVMTGEKFTSLFGNLAPSLSLLLVMIFRMVPNLMRHAAQISSARKCIGKGGAEDAGFIDKVKNGMTLMESLASWALEGSIVTADSMRCRGYGSTKRTTFMPYHMTVRDWILVGIMLILAAVVLTIAVLGFADATFTPRWHIPPVSGWSGIALVAYFFYLLIPVALYIEEAVRWHNSILKI